MTMEELVRRYFNSRNGDGSPRARRTEWYRAQTILRIIGDHENVRSVDADVLQRFIHYRRLEGVSPTTIRKEVETFVTMRNHVLCPSIRGLRFR